MRLNVTGNIQREKCVSCQTGALKNPTQEEEMKEGRKEKQEKESSRITHLVLNL